MAKMLSDLHKSQYWSHNSTLCLLLTLSKYRHAKGE